MLKSGTPIRGWQAAAGSRRTLSYDRGPCQGEPSWSGRSGCRVNKEGLPRALACRRRVPGRGGNEQDRQRLSAFLSLGQFRVLQAGVRGCSCRPATTLDSRDESPRAIRATEPFQASNVLSDIPCLRQRSAHFAPASCSCGMAMICSSLSRAFFIVRPRHGPDPDRRWRKNPLAGHRILGIRVRDELRRLPAAYLPVGGEVG